MASVKRIQFSTVIHAAPATVWRLMFGAESYKQWTAAFTAGSYYEGSWDEGARIRFLAPSGGGMVSEIAASRPHVFLSIRHLGFIMNGVEDTSSDAVRSWAPAYENYTFVAVPEGTRLVVDQDVTADFEDAMQEAWPKALALLKQISEQAA